MGWIRRFLEKRTKRAIGVRLTKYYGNCLLGTA